MSKNYYNSSTNNNTTELISQTIVQEDYDTDWTHSEPVIDTQGGYWVVPNKYDTDNIYLDSAKLPFGTKVWVVEGEYEDVNITEDRRENNLSHASQQSTQNRSHVDKLTTFNDWRVSPVRLPYSSDLVKPKHAAFYVIGDYLYMFGGRDESNVSDYTKYSDKIYRINVSSGKYGYGDNEWELYDIRLPLAAALLDIYRVGNYIYMYGGWTSSGDSYVWRCTLDANGNDFGQIYQITSHTVKPARLGQSFITNDFIIHQANKNNVTMVGSHINTNDTIMDFHTQIPKHNLPYGNDSKSPIFNLGKKLYLMNKHGKGTKLWECTIESNDTLSAWTDSSLTLPSSCHFTNFIVTKNHIYLLSASNYHRPHGNHGWVGHIDENDVITHWEKLPNAIGYYGSRSIVLKNEILLLGTYNGTGKGDNVTVHDFDGWDSGRTSNRYPMSYTSRVAKFNPTPVGKIMTVGNIDNLSSRTRLIGDTSDIDLDTKPYKAFPINTVYTVTRDDTRIDSNLPIKTYRESSLSESIKALLESDNPRNIILGSDDYPDLVVSIPLKVYIENDNYNSTFNQYESNYNDGYCEFDTMFQPHLSNDIVDTNGAFGTISLQSDRFIQGVASEHTVTCITSKYVYAHVMTGELTSACYRRRYFNNGFIPQVDWEIDPNYAIPICMTHRSGIQLNNRFYFMGGTDPHTNVNHDDNTNPATDEIWYRDIDENGELGPYMLHHIKYPIKIAHARLVTTAEGTLYAIGGMDNGHLSVNKVYEFKYDTTGDIYSVRYAGILPVPLKSTTIARTKSRVYVIGGVHTTSINPITQTIKNTIYFADIDPLTGMLGNWTLSGYRLPHAGYGMTPIVFKDKMYLVGGMYSNDYSNDSRRRWYVASIDEYGHISHVFQSSSGHRHDGFVNRFISFRLKNKLYMIGGLKGGVYDDKIYVSTYNSTDLNYDDDKYHETVQTNIQKRTYSIDITQAFMENPEIYGLDIKSIEVPSIEIATNQNNFATLNDLLLRVRVYTSSAVLIASNDPTVNNYIEDRLTDPSQNTDCYIDNDQIYGSILLSDYMHLSCSVSNKEDRRRYVKIKTSDSSIDEVKLESIELLENEVLRRTYSHNPENSFRSFQYALRLTDPIGSIKNFTMELFKIDES